MGILKRNGVNLGRGDGRKIECICFADNMVLLAEKEQTMLADLNTSFEEFGVRINWEKGELYVVTL